MILTLQPQEPLGQLETGASGDDFNNSFGADQDCVVHSVEGKV